MIRYAIPKPEPLLTELGNFAAAVRGEPAERGHPGGGPAPPCGVAEALRESADDRPRPSRWRREDHRRRAGQDRPSAGRAVRRPRAPRRRAPTSTADVVARGARGPPAVPRRGRPRRAAGRRGRRRACWRRPRTPPRRCRRATRSWSSSRSSSTASGDPDFSAIDAATADDRRAGCAPGTLVTYETTLPVGTTRNRLGPHAGAAQRPARRRRLLPGLQPGAGLVRAGVRRPRPLPEAGRRRRRGERARGPRSSTPAGWTSTSGPTSPRPNGVWDLGSAEAAELAKLAETTYRDVNIGLANQFALLRRPDRRRRAPGDRGVQLAAVQPPAPARASRWAGTASRSTRGSTSAGDPDATIVRAARDGQRGHARALRRRCWPQAYGDLTGATVVVLGACYRGGVKETAFSGVFADGRGAAPARARCRWCTTRCTARASSPRLGLDAVPAGAARSTPRWCRPTTPSTARCTGRTCPASGSSSTAATCSTPRELARTSRS